MILRAKLYFSLITAAVIIIVNHYAVQYNAYDIFNWFDIPMHIAGGIMVGFFGYTIIDFVNKDYSNNRKKRFVLLFVLGVGVIWEFIETLYGVGGLSVEYRLNTIKDIFDDVLGGGLSILIWNFLFVKTDKIK